VGINVGWGKKMGVIIIDERGRITIPKEDREKAGLKEGDKLKILVEKGKIVFKKVINIQTFINELEGCIKTPGDINPQELKKIWGLIP